MKTKLRNKFDVDNMSIAKKLKASFGILVGLTVIVSIFGIVGIWSLNHSLANLVSKTEMANEAIKMCRIETNIAARNVREMALNDDKSSYSGYKEKIEENLTATGDELKTLKQSGVVSTSMYKEYAEELTAWANDAYAIVETIEAGDREKGTEMIFSDCIPALDRMVTIAQKMNTQIENKVASSVGQSRAIFYTGIIVMIVVTALAVAISLLLGKRLIESIITPLLDIEASARELSEGNLHTEISYRSEDELGKLAHNLRSSINTLSGYVDGISQTMGEFAKGNFDTVTAEGGENWKGDFVEIKEAMSTFEKNISETVEGMQQVATQVESGASQVSDSSMDLAEGATEQAGVMEEFTATVDAVSEQVSENASYAVQISQRVEEVGAEIKNTNDGMRRMVESMNNIQESSQRIHKIIDTINDVAEQTNLLALNASIEAARAGEAGRGFAVVANQVTALATQSAEAARESAELIEASMMEVENGMTLTTEIASQQEHLAVDAKAIVDEVNYIANTLKAQKDSFEQLDEGITQINDVIQTNSATSQQCAASSLEMSNQASTLGQLIQKFKVASA